MFFKLESHAISDVGLVRINNEDVWASLPAYQFFILADGMGGHKAGEVAAKQAVMSVCHSIHAFFRAPSRKIALGKAPKKQLISLLRESIVQANQEIYRLACCCHDLVGMGTTLCCFLLYEGILFYAHVGDSRLYRFRKGLKQLTHDHSLRYELLSRGQLAPEEVAFFPYRNIITRAVGTSPFITPEIGMSLVLPDDIYFLCTDGLTDPVSDQEIAWIIDRSPTIGEASLALVDTAKAKGGSDNITIVMAKVALL